MKKTRLIIAAAAMAALLLGGGIYGRQIMLMHLMRTGKKHRHYRLVCVPRC